MKQKANYVPVENRPILTLDGVSAYTGVPMHALLAAMEKHPIPFFTLNGFNERLVTVEDLLEWIDRAALKSKYVREFRGEK